MAAKRWNALGVDLRRAALAGDGAGLSDAQLLDGFVVQQDEAAFTALVRRHGPMVWGICRRLLQNDQDAEDAFQATFLVLARKARSIRQRERFANWLYGVASRTALKAREAARRRRVREREMAARQRQTTAPEPWRDLEPVLDRELSLLPTNYRLPVLLCDLQGRTRREAAQQLGWAEGTLSSRLARGRALLARRLARYAPLLSVEALTVILAQNTASADVPTLLLAPAAGISPTVALLAKGVIQDMLLNRLKLAVLLCLVCTGLLAGMGQWLHSVSAADEEGPVVQLQHSQKPAPATEFPERGQPAAPAAVPDPLDVLLQAQKNLTGLRSAAGTAVYEVSTKEEDRWPEPRIKARVQVYFAEGKHHLRFQYERLQTWMVPSDGSPRRLLNYKPDDLAMIHDGEAVRVVSFSSRFKPTGCQIELFQGLRNPAAFLEFNHPVELWREVANIEAMVKNLGRDAIKMTRLDSGIIRGTCRIKNEPPGARVEFEARPEDGYHISRHWIFNPGQDRPATTKEIAWAQAKGVWYAKQLADEREYPYPHGPNMRHRWVFRYETFEPGAMVDPKLFTLDCLSIPERTRTLDHRPKKAP